jgi:hypothetical protein
MLKGCDSLAEGLSWSTTISSYYEAPILLIDICLPDVGHAMVTNIDTLVINYNQSLVISQIIIISDYELVV